MAISAELLNTLGALTIDDVFRSVILATLKSSSNHALRTAYDQILNDLDNDKDITFAHIQTVCARQFRRTKGSHPDSSFRADTPRATQRTSPVKTEEYNKYKHQGGNELAAFLCNTLEKHGDQPGKVLRRAGLAGAEWNEPASVTTPSSWPPRNTSPYRSPVTPTMTMTPTMTLLPPMNYVEGLSLTTSLRYQDSCLENS